MRRDETKLDRRPILGTLVIAVVSMAACVSPFEPEGDPPPEEPDPNTDCTAGQVYSGGMLVRLV